MWICTTVGTVVVVKFLGKPVICVHIRNILDQRTHEDTYISHVAMPYSRNVHKVAMHVHSGCSYVAKLTWERYTAQL